jgi:transglutaminase/protease-like cytokinesis protein 3
MTRTLSILLIFTFVWQINAQRSDFKNINFKKADNIAMSLQGEALNNLPLLAYKLTYKLDTDVERFRAIYFWVCHNIENDYDLMQKNKRKRRKFRDHPKQLETWNKTFKKEVFQKLLNNKKTLCSGYAYLIKVLASHAGLTSEIVKGYGKISATFKSIKTPNHAWNSVKLDGKWYVCDATWASGFITEALLFEFNYNDAYFLMEPQEFAKSHQPLDVKWLL